MVQDSKRLRQIKFHRIFALSSLVFIFSCKVNDTNSIETKSSELPNIVLIVGDDQGYPYFGFMGADYVSTPNMDKLAASGTLFTNAYVPANHCRPSLQSLMTGTLPIVYNQTVDRNLKEQMSKMRFASEEDRQRFEQEFKHNAMRDFETLPGILNSMGYKSFQGGKWWEFHYENGGFSHGMTTGWTQEDQKNGAKWFKQFMGGSGLDLGRKTMEPVYEFVEENNKDPFFIWFAPELPHYPFDAPDKYYNLYTDKNMTESAMRYYANCTWFDDCVGSLVEFLKEKNEHENTLYVYVNDNGWEQNPDQEFRHDSLRWHNGGDKGKLSIYDQSFRTPVIFSWAKHIDSKVNKHSLVHSTDIPVTILDFLGKEYQSEPYGVSLTSTIQGKEDNLRDKIIGKVHKLRSEEDYMGMDVDAYWMRSGKWYYVWNKTFQTKTLYDLDNDLNCDKDLAKKHPEIVKEYTKDIEAWIENYANI